MPVYRERIGVLGPFIAWLVRASTSGLSATAEYNRPRRMPFNYCKISSNISETKIGAISL